MGLIKEAVLVIKNNFPIKFVVGATCLCGNSEFGKSQKRKCFVFTEGKGVFLAKCDCGWQNLFLLLAHVYDNHLKAKQALRLVFRSIQSRGVN